MSSAWNWHATQWTTNVSLALAANTDRDGAREQSAVVHVEAFFLVPVKRPHVRNRNSLRMNAPASNALVLNALVLNALVLDPLVLNALVLNVLVLNALVLNAQF